MQLSSRSKLAIIFAVTLALVWGATAFVLFRVVVVHDLAAFDSNLDHLCSVLWAYIDVDPATGSARLTRGEGARDAFALQESRQFFEVYDAETGRLLLDSQGSKALTMALAADDVKRIAGRDSYQDVSSSGHAFRFRSIKLRANGRAYLLRVGASSDDLWQDRRQLSLILMIVIPIATLIAGIVGWWIASRALRAMDELKRAADQISIGQLDRPLSVNSFGAEMNHAVTSLNDALKRVKSGVDLVKNFSAWTAHELRTPLTILRGEAEVALARTDLSTSCRELIYGQLEQFEKLSTMMDRFLVLAQAQAGEISLQRDECDVSTIASEVVDMFMPVATVRNIELGFERGSAVLVIGDKGWLDRVVANLLDNALKFTNDGGHVKVSAHSGASAILEVSDDGPGIPAEDLPYVFDCFYRSKNPNRKRRPGNGLGLALAKWVVDQHGGEIRAESVLGQGTTFTVTLPLSEQGRVASAASRVSTAQIRTL